MKMYKRMVTLLILTSFCSVFAADYLIVEAPIGTVQSDKVVWIKWTGTSRGTTYLPPDSGYIYFDRAPGGGKLSNYRYKVTVPVADTCNNKYFPIGTNGPVAKRGTAFKPVDQENMRSGVYYCVVGLPAAGDTLVSNEFQIIVETPDPVKLLSPSGSISDLTPTFSWNANAGVPYYHIILSDEAIKVDSTSGTVDIQGLSVVWQAITPNTQIVYGTPDPSHTITADPPPLSPGQHYTWIVLNNYGNNAAFSSTKVNLPPGEFTIGGTALKKPKCTYPVNISLNNRDNNTIKFKWTNLDQNANTYKVYVYVDQDLYGVKAKMAVYQTEVAATGLSDTLSVDINAGSVFTSNTYSWRAIAIDSKGAGSTSDTVSFNYSAPTGTIKVHTRELLKSGNTTDTSVVGLVELKVEVLDGSLEAPLLFYTDNNGELNRSRPTGTYRITAVKSQFESMTKTITLSEGQTSDITFFMERPEATVFGKVVDESNKGINLAKVKGVSDRGDTVSTLTDASGNFILNCYGADWNINAELTGYKTVLPKKVTVDPGSSYNFGTIQMQRNPFTLSGVVKNTSGEAMLGVDVGLYRDGLLIDRVPSTPQNGSFSFSIPSGTYTITAQKNGFVSYSGNIDVLNSKNINITMAPGAALVSGYVYGSVWVGERQIIAPITGATIKFVNISGADSFTTKTDVTYGDFKISLPGAVKYLVFSSANGYATKAVPCTLTTIQKSTQILNDTLQSLGMISGNVSMDSTNLPVGNVSINMQNTVSNVITTGKSSADGYFEIRGIPDGSYNLNAGKSGLVLDSISGGYNVVKIVNGKPNINNLKIFMKTGSKTIKWQLTGISQLDGTVKLQSPLYKTLSAVDSVSQVGSGTYVVQIDAKSDSVIDMSYHRFSVGDTEVVHVDTITMNVKHHRSDSLTPVNGTVSVVLSSTDTLDSAYIYFKDYVSSQYAVSKVNERKAQYVFSIVPPRDGSTMQYFFKAFRKNDVYGYDKEVYNTFIKPDKSRLTKCEINPGFSDTLLYPSGYNITFTFNGYYSSNFIKNELINEKSISWSLSNPQGCVLKNSKGLSTTISTGSLPTSTPVIVTVTIDTNLTKLSAGVKSSLSTSFKVSGYELKKISVKRIDSRNPNPIFTTNSDVAEFGADGIDTKGNALSISPSWEVYPSSAGNISSDGVFHPSKNFVGYARVFAKSGNLSGEYIIEGAKNIGLDVQHMISYSNQPDTATNGNGCSIVFPLECIAKGDIGVLELKNVIIKNQIMRGLGEYKTIDSIAYDIKELKDIAFNFKNDSIRLIFDLPSGYQKQALSGAGKIQVACWDEDSLKWDSLTSKVSTDGKQVSVGLKHFSIYTVIAQSTNSQFLEVSPNPFSPYVRPSNPLNPKGTCIKFRFDSPTSNLYDVRVRVYNVVGDLVWSLQIQNAKTQMYTVWWDGKASTKELLWNHSGTEISNLNGDLMCRNGRYFVVVSAKDQDNKTRQIMKPVIILK